MAIFIVGLLLFMLGFSFASVPLYRIFCQKTGYGGTTQVALEPCTKPISNRTLRIRFNANVYRGLPWDFSPLQTEITVKAGETGLAFYQVSNFSNQSVVGIASYNVTPDKAGPYFNKIACFCFEEQLIPANTTLDMPVQFFIDPDIIKDPNLNDVETITLSYTFFQLKDFKR